MCCLCKAGTSTASEIEPFIKKNCLECHNGPDGEGKFDITPLSPELANADTYARWVMVHDRVAAGEMPPPENGKLDRDEIRSFVTSTANRLTRFEIETDHGTVRRLNRVEYQNTLRDLLKLPRLDVVTMLPEDAVAHGYSKVPWSCRMFRFENISTPPKSRWISVWLTQRHRPKRTCGERRS